MTFSCRTYLPSSRAKLPYARGCVLDFRKTPSGAKEPESIHGRSLVADLSSESGSHPSARYFGQVRQLEMARIDDLKIIRNRSLEGSEEIYDLSADPLERVNLADRSPEQRKNLLELSAELDHATAEMGPSIQQQDVSEEEEALEALRALGYIE